MLNPSGQLWCSSAFPCVSDEVQRIGASPHPHERRLELCTLPSCPRCAAAVGAGHFASRGILFEFFIAGPPSTSRTAELNNLACSSKSLVLATVLMELNAAHEAFVSLDIFGSKSFLTLSSDRNKCIPGLSPERLLGGVQDLHQQILFNKFRL